MKKIAVIVVASLVVLLVGAYAVVSLLFDEQAQRTALEQRLETAFGRNATVESVDLQPFGGPAVVATGIRVQRDPQFGEGPILEIPRAEANISFWDYITSGEIVIENLALENPTVTLVKSESGIWNFRTLGVGAAPPASPPSAALPPRLGPALTAIQLPAARGIDDLTIERIEVQNADVAVINREVDPTAATVYKNIDVMADVERTGEVYHADGRLTADSAAVGGEPLLADLPFQADVIPASREQALRASGAIEPGRFATRNLQLDTVQTNFAFDAAQALELNNFRADLYGGTLTGQTVLALTQLGNPFRADFALNNVALEGLFASRPDLAQTLGGRITGNFQGGGDLGGLNYTLQTLQGGGQLAVADAKLSSVNILDVVARRGGLTGVQFEEQGTHAERIEGAYQLGGGRVMIQNAAITNINGYANATAQSGWIDLTAPASLSLVGDVTLLPPLFQKVRGANPVADVLLGVVDRQGSVTVPLTVHGPIENPTVGVRWSEVLRQYIPAAGLLPFLGIG